MDLDQVAAELYGGPPEDFTRLRKERAAEVRKAGDRELAKQITALRRPTRSAWIVNLLSDQAEDDLAALLDLGAALAQAQQQLSGPELRKLSGQRNAAVAALVRRGAQLAEVRGHSPSEATMREVSTTLQAALADPEVAAEVRQGRVTQAREYSGFGPVLPAPIPVEQDQQPAPATPSEDDQTDSEHEQLIKQLNSSQAALDRIRTSLQHHRERSDRAAETAARRTARVAELQDQLDRARRDADQANDELVRLRADEQHLQDAERAAEAAVSQVLGRLADS